VSLSRGPRDHHEMRLSTASPVHPSPGARRSVGDFAGPGRLAPAQGGRVLALRRRWSLRNHSVGLTKRS
jgi:hypothetical protein